MTFINKAARIADRLLGAFTGLLAAVLLIYSGYVIFDNHYKGQSAFISWDLLQYKPVVTEGDTLDFEEIQKINPDAVGWITIFNTNINYPLAQGKNDLEYINKDIFGQSSLTGSIYLSSENSRDFSDSFNIIYGHHMDNGAMFGDVDKYADEEYFLSHQKGELLTPAQAYDLTVFACLKTDAYDSEIYSIAEKANEELGPVIEYIKENADRYVETNTRGIKKIVGLSTCANATTNGRVIIFCNADPTEKRAAAITEDPGEIERVAVGHGGTDPSNNWALLNLICVIITVFTLLPLTFIHKKFRQISYSKTKAKELDVFIADCGENESVPRALEDLLEEFETIVKDLRRFIRGVLIGLVGEIIVSLTAVIAFILTENIHSQMVLSDKYTGLMLIIACAALVIDFVFFRYRGELPPENIEDYDDFRLQKTKTPAHSV